MEIKQVLLKTRAEFGKQCIFDMSGPHLDEEIKPNPIAMADYIIKSQCNVDVQHTKQLALHEVQTIGKDMKSSGMFHFEGGWPKEINPKDEEAVARFRRRVEKEEDWAPKMLNLLEQMECKILQNGALNIYENYFDDMIPTELLKPRHVRTVNIYEDSQTPPRLVNNISWSPDEGTKMVVSYCYFGIEPGYSNTAYIWQIDNPNKPWMMLEAASNPMVSDFNLRDPSILASGLKSGQVCSWDIRTGTAPVQMSHRQFSHRDCTTVLKWVTSKSNTEFFSGSSDGCVMWWDTRNLRKPIEVLVFDLQTPNQPEMDRAIGVLSTDYEPSVGTKFMFGLENGIVVSGSRKARTPAEKIALKFNAHFGPVFSVDRSSYNPKLFLTIGDGMARVWAEDTKEGSLASTKFMAEHAVCGCWNRARHSIFYIASSIGVLSVWDLLVSLEEPILAVKLCEDKLTAVTSHEMGSLIAVGNTAGNVYLMELSEALYSFDKNDRNELTSYLERCSRFVKAIDTRIKEMKLAKAAIEESEITEIADLKDRRKDRKDKLKELKPLREKTKILSKKKVKDEISEFQEVENKFFEIVKMEKQKYEDIMDIQDLDLSRSKFNRLMKKPAERKSAKDLIDETKLENEIPSKIKFKEHRVKYSKKTEIVEISKPEIERKPSSLLEIEPSVEAIVEPPPQEISKRKRRKKARKKRLMPVIFRLAKPCKLVCKPAICCRRIAPRKLIRDRAVKDREKWDERMRLKDDDIGARPSIKSEIRGEKRIHWMELLRDYKRKKLTRKYSGEEKIRFLWKVMEPPEEFAEMPEEAKKAKKEIQEEDVARTKARKLAKEALKSREYAAVKKSRDTQRESRRREEDLVKEVTTKRILRSFARKGRKVCRTVDTTDPCIPIWKPPSLAKDLQTLFVGFPSESIEKETTPDVAGTEEI